MYTTKEQVDNVIREYRLRKRWVSSLTSFALAGGALGLMVLALTWWR